MVFRHSADSGVSYLATLSTARGMALRAPHKTLARPVFHASLHTVLARSFHQHAADCLAPTDRLTMSEKSGVARHDATHWLALSLKAMAIAIAFFLDFREISRCVGIRLLFAERIPNAISASRASAEKTSRSTMESSSSKNATQNGGAPLRRIRSSQREIPLPRLTFLCRMILPSNMLKVHRG